jgi:molecular chaperone GrpE (heat shock protein)
VNADTDGAQHDPDQGTPAVADATMPSDAALQNPAVEQEDESPDVQAGTSDTGAATGPAPQPSPEAQASDEDEPEGTEHAAGDTLDPAVDVTLREEPTSENEQQAEPSEPAVDPAVAELQAKVAALSEDLATAQRRADDAATVARRQSEMADELHAENRRLREGEIREAVAPLIRGLARLSDDLSRMRDPKGEQSADVAFIDSRVEELLHDAGVMAVRPATGDSFDPLVHQATGSATTDDPDADRCVAELRRAGLRRDDGRILRPADVVVFRYTIPAATAATDTHNDTTGHAS